MDGVGSHIPVLGGQGHCLSWEHTWDIHLRDHFIDLKSQMELKRRLIIVKL